MKGFTVFLVVVAAVSISGDNSLKWGQYAGDYEGNFVVKIAKDNEFLCMGSIIYPQWVLTTAHCLENENITITAGSNWFSTSTRLNEDSLQTRLVTNKNHYVVHPNYTSQNSASQNIGLIYIEEPFNLTVSPRVSRILLPTNKYRPISGKVFSWGERFYIFPLASKLHVTNVCEVHDNDYCASRGLQPQQPYLMCSYGHSSPYYFDEGGPLVAPTFKGRTLVGIINRQIPQNQESNPWFNTNAPTHYTSVPYFAKWIADVVNSFVAPDY